MTGPKEKKQKDASVSLIAVIGTFGRSDRHRRDSGDNAGAVEDSNAPLMTRHRRARHSPLMPVALMIGHHFSISAF
jgi:hypothetical protein